MLSYSDFYNSSELSDARVLVQVIKESEIASTSTACGRPRTSRSSKRLKSTQPSAEEKAEVETVVEYPAHRLVLMAHSQYFRTRLQEKWCPNSTDPPTISLIVTEQQVSAAKVLFKFLYYDRLPDDFGQQDLVNLITLADKYQVDSCINQCVKYCADLLDARLEWSTILQLLALPESILETQQGKALLECVKVKVFSQLGNLDSTLQDDARRQKLSDLPLAIVEDLLRRDALQVSCENVVMVAISVWLAAYDQSHGPIPSGADPLASMDSIAKHRTAVGEAGEQLLQHVRVRMLTPSFLKAAVIAYPWFSRSPQGTGAMLLAEALSYQLSGEASKRRLEERTAQTDKHHRLNPRTGLPGGAPPPAELTIEWQVSVQEMLLREQEATRTCHNIWICSPFYFFRGYMFALYLIIFPGPGKPSHGKLYLGLRWHLGDDTDGERSKQLPSIPLQCQARVVLQHRPTPLVFKKKAQPGSAYDWRGFGWPRVFEDADRGSWEQYSTNGKLHFTASISDVE